MKTIVEYLINNHVSSQNAMIDSLSDKDYFVIEYDENNSQYRPAKIMGKFKSWHASDGKPYSLNTYFQINMGQKNVAGVYQNGLCSFYAAHKNEFLREPTSDELEILKEIDNEITITTGGKIIGEFDYNTNKFSQVF